MPEPRDAEAWNKLADSGRAVLLVSAIGSSLRSKDPRTSVDALTAVLTTHAACKFLKAVWHEPRPNRENCQSFPSQHAAESFAAATILRRPFPAMAGPTAIGASVMVSLARAFSGKHHVPDIIAGAAIGCLAAHIVTGAQKYRSVSAS